MPAPLMMSTTMATSNIPSPLKSAMMGGPGFVPPGSRRLLIVGADGETATVKLTALDVPPPGAGFVTVMLPVVGETRSAWGTTPMISVLLTKKVWMGTLFQFTTDTLKNPVPVR